MGQARFGPMAPEAADALELAAIDALAAQQGIQRLLVPLAALAACQEVAAAAIEDGRANSVPCSPA
jgi:hypothetical protein